MVVLMMTMTMKMVIMAPLRGSHLRSFLLHGDIFLWRSSWGWRGWGGWRGRHGEWRDMPMTEPPSIFTEAVGGGRFRRFRYNSANDNHRNVSICTQCIA